MSWRVVAVLAVVTVLGGLLAGTAYCQQGGGGGRGAGGAGGGRGRFDPEQMRQQMAERMREALGATEEEWQVLGPRVTKVQDLSNQLSARGVRAFGRRGGRGGRGGAGGGPGGAEAPQTDLQKAETALQEGLADASASNADIAAGLKAVREEREKVKQAMEVAQKELREVITLRQEAQLVLMGLLD